MKAVIIHHFKEFFELTGKTMQDTNGEYVETLHSSLRVHEETHGYKVKRKMGTPIHLNKAKKSITSFNSVRAGFSPAHELTLRRKLHSPSSISHLYLSPRLSN